MRINRYKSVRNLVVLVIAFFLIISKSTTQTVVASYNLLEVTYTSVKFEILVSKSTPAPMKLSGITTYFLNTNTAFQGTTAPLWVEGPVFATLNDPVPTLTALRVRAAQAPIGSSGGAIELTETPTVFGTITVFSTQNLPNPAILTPNASYQAVVYLNNSPTPTTVVVSAEPISFNVYPIQLDGFTAEKLGDRSSLLNWGTVTETSSSHFGIERSVNGYKWETIGRVQAAGYSRMERAYRYIDDNLPRIGTAGKVIYYRLKIVDRDGRYQYSEMRTVIFEGKEEGQIMLYPNPATKSVNVDLTGVGHNGAQLELSVMDVDGRLVIQRTIEGVDSYELDVAGLTANVYHIRVSQGDRVYQTRLVKVD